MYGTLEYLLKLLHLVVVMDIPSSRYGEAQVPTSNRKQGGWITFPFIIGISLQLMHTSTNTHTHICTCTNFLKIYITICLLGSSYYKT